MLTCPRCGKQFNKHPAGLKRNKSGVTYCSRVCRFADKRIKRICPTCSKQFTIIRSWSGSANNFCSRKCAHTGLRVEKPILTCAFCGKGFARYPSEIKKMGERGYRHVFCSHKCRAAMIAAQFNPPVPYLGEHTSCIRNGRETVKWRKAVLMRDSYTCQECKAANVLLCAHHIKPYILYPELRYAVTNGITLCYPCHERQHSLSD